MNWLSIGLKILPFIVTAVKTVESFFKAKGKAKEDAAHNVPAPPSVVDPANPG